jgi:periplasmic protein TonB
LYRTSPEFVTQSVAFAVTTAAFIALCVNRQVPAPVLRTSDPGVQISLAEEVPAPPPPQPEPAHLQPHAVLPTRRQAAPLIAAKPMITEPTHDSDAAIELPAEPPAPAPATAPSHVNIEAEYAAALRKNVDERTEVPSTAEYRLLRPSGSAMVCFTLDRSGNPSDVALKRSSGSKILDTQAARIVASGRYPPFPEGSFPGELQHVFIVTIEFRS